VVCEAVDVPWWSLTDRHTDRQAVRTPTCIANPLMFCGSWMDWSLSWGAVYPYHEDQREGENDDE
jgi:hypothetical protein